MDKLPELTRLVNEESGGTTHHHLCHYVPARDNPENFDVKIASDFVSLRVLEKIISSDFEARNRVIRYLHDIPQGASYRGYLFEMRAHEFLVHDGSIDAVRLDDTPDRRQHKVFQCIKSADFYFFDPKTLSKKTLRAGPYHIPCVSNFESVDSFY
ncbi:unnamed protein product [Phytophthora lilii]|uniref:Unnamed protein product n=1 Tax=Phytophthora lilii TaxID=2077276 RepID=A0A9W6X4L1_9STRA|nr:unnamed protein product [Phytophthora lilii]